MDDLRRRFASLDRMPAPDQWDTIERRAAALEPVARVTAVVTPVPLGSPRSSRRSFVLLAATVGLLVALVGSALVIGSRRPLLPAIVPVASASASLAPSSIPGTPSPSITPAPSGLASQGQAPWIVFLVNGSSVGPSYHRSSLWAMRSDGSGSHAVGGGVPVAWSRDGTRLLTLDDTFHDNGSVLVADVGEDVGPFVDTGVVVPVNEQWEAFDFAPDGVRVVDVRKSKCRTRSSGTGSGSAGVVLAMYVAETAGANCYVLSILDLRTGELTDLEKTLVKDQTGNRNLALELPAWSPDGTKIAYTRLDETLNTRELWVVNTDGTNASRVALAADVSVQEPRWSPDGTRISFTSETQPSVGASESSVYVAEVATGRLERVTIGSDPAVGQVCCAEWLDNTRLRVEGRSPADANSSPGYTDRFWLVALDVIPHEAEVLVDLTEPLAAIDPPRSVTMRSAPGDPGRRFFWQPVPVAQP